jgi:hypothetical protein
MKVDAPDIKETVKKIKKQIDLVALKEKAGQVGELIETSKEFLSQFPHPSPFHKDKTMYDYYTFCYRVSGDSSRVTLGRGLKKFIKNKEQNE